MLSPGERLLNGRYVLQGLLGYGKYAEVYLAIDEHLQNTGGGDPRVAIKILKKEHWNDTEAKQRLAREGELQIESRLGRHNKIVKVLECGTHSLSESDQILQRKVPFLVMNYVEHITLHDYLQQNSGIAPIDEVLLAIILQLGGALSWIHSRSQPVIHRDLADHNILLRCRQIPNGYELLTEREDFVLLSDFGLAYVRGDQGITSEGPNKRIAANIRYASPQILFGNVPTPSDDIYSFGVLVYQMLTGRLPFPYETDSNHPNGFLEFAECVRDRPPKFSHSDSVSETVQDIVLKALAKDHKARHKDALDMAKALQQALAPQIVTGETQVSPPIESITAEPTPTTPETVVPVPTPPAEKKPWHQRLWGCLWRTLGVLLLLGILLIIGSIGWAKQWLDQRASSLDNGSPTPSATIEQPISGLPLPTQSTPPQETLPSVPTAAASPLVATAQPGNTPTAIPTAIAIPLSAIEADFAYVSYQGTFPALMLDQIGNDSHTPIHTGLSASVQAFQNPVWSPQGDLLAYTAETPEGSAIYLYDGLNTRRLSASETSERWPTWAADGNSLLVSGLNPEGIWQLYQLDVHTGARSPLTGPQFNAWAPAWSPANNYVAYISDAQGRDDIYVLDLDQPDQPPLNISQSGGVYPNQPAWAPDGKWLVYATETGLRWISIENLQPGRPQPFTANAQDRFPCFISPTQILFQRTSGAGTSSIYRARVGNNDPERLVDNAGWPACHQVHLP